MERLLPEKLSSATAKKWWWVGSVQLGQAGGVVSPLNSLSGAHFVFCFTTKQKSTPAAPHKFFVFCLLWYVSCMFT